MHQVTFKWKRKVNNWIKPNVTTTKVVTNRTLSDPADTQVHDHLTPNTGHIRTASCSSLSPTNKKGHTRTLSAGDKPYCEGSIIEGMSCSSLKTIFNGFYWFLIGFRLVNWHSYCYLLVLHSTISQTTQYPQ